MALANLTINVIANTGAAQTGLRDVGATAQDAFTRSNAAVDKFRGNIDRSADDLGAAAQKIGSNMQAANDAIVSGSAKSEAALKRVSATADAVDMKSFGEKVSAAFGTAFATSYVAAQTWAQKTEDFVKEKAKYIAIGLAVAAVSATAGVVYGAYRLITGSFDFIKGLFTGDSYKSANIDALIALNGQVVDLQHNLQLSAQEASALLDATSRLGVDKGDYTAAYTGAANAMRSNGDELDRLGVKYKDQNGNLLTQRQFLENVKSALDEYSAGYERNAAATAMAAGSYEQITAALKVSEAELQASKERLDEYGVSIGPNTQAAVAAYQQAMRDFNNETELTSRGFSRAVADNIMPLLADLAEFFKDGFPVAVQVFRVAISSVTGLFYAFKDGVYIVAESVLGSVESIGLALGGLGSAAAKAFTGDFTGAKNALLGGLEEAQARFVQIGSNIVAQVMHNDAAIKLATGNDDRRQSLDDARATVDKRGKKFVPKPDAPDKPTTPDVSAYQKYLDELDRTLTKVQENEYAAMRLKAAQLAQKEGIKDLSAAYDKINAIQRGESQRVVDDMTHKLSDETAAYAFQTSIMGLTALEQDKLTFGMQKRLELEQSILSAKKSGKPLDDQAIADLRSQTEATIALGQAQRDQRDAMSRTAEAGINSALQQYKNDATNAAKYAESAVTGSLTRIEDALINFEHTGKLSFSNLFQFMADEFIRQQIRMQLSNAASGFQSIGGIAGVLGSIGSAFFASNTGVAADTAAALPGDPLDNMINITGGFGTIPSHATGLDYVPYDGYVAELHKGERVMTAANNESYSGGGDVHYSPTYHFGHNVSQQDVAMAVQMGAAQTKRDIYTSMRRGGAFSPA